uniref:ZMYM2-like/QRICH1 C-terminal domain-containing protein n=1 Tax=Falco tinnunculus TaxID=100819 RepID=A0A8C4U3P9_FALTI
MSKSVGNGRCNDASSLHMDLSKLVTWAHTHGTICNQIPVLKTAQNFPSKDNSILWMCGVGHAYHWQCGHLYVRIREENEAVESRKRLVSSEVSPLEANLDEKRFRMTPSFERAKADAVDTGSCSRSPEVTQQQDTCYLLYNELSPRENKNPSKSVKSCFTAAQHLSVSDSEVKTDRYKVKPESNEELQIISDDEQCKSDDDDQQDQFNEYNLAESPMKSGTAEVNLQMHQSQKKSFDKLTATQMSGFDATGKPPQTLACILKSPGSDQESLDSSFLMLGPLNPAGSITETSRARNSFESTIPQEHLKSVPVSNIEEKAQLESPTSVSFFEFEATVDVQQELELSPSEPGTPGIGLSGNVTENPAKESEPSQSGHAPHLSASLSSESKNTDHPPAFLNKNVLKWDVKRNRNTGDIKTFRDWLVLHCPSEMREIHKLPPEDLDNYLALFYSSAKRQNGGDFSARSLHSFQSNIKRYLKDHNYKYSLANGLEFRASQEALKLKLQHLCQKEREEEWSLLENLTDEDVQNLRRKGLLSKMHPQGFLHLIFTNLIRAFGASTHSQSHSLYWGQLVLKKNEQELEYLEWLDDLSAEVSAGESGPRLFAKPEDPDNCPVTDYKEYAKRRPQDMLHYYNPLYLAPKPLCSIWDQIWYCRKSLTKSKLEKILKVIIHEVRGPVKTSNK